MIGVHAYVVELEIERVCAYGQVFELVLVKVRPSPQTGIDDVWEAFATGYL